MKKVVSEMKRTLSAVLAVMMVLTAVPQTAMTVMADDQIENVYVDEVAEVDELGNVYVADEDAVEETAEDEIVEASKGPEKMKTTISINAVAGATVVSISGNKVRANDKTSQFDGIGKFNAVIETAPLKKAEVSVSGNGILGESTCVYDARNKKNINTVEITSYGDGALTLNVDVANKDSISFNAVKADNRVMNILVNDGAGVTSVPVEDVKLTADMVYGYMPVVTGAGDGFEIVGTPNKEANASVFESIIKAADLVENMIVKIGAKFDEVNFKRVHIDVDSATRNAFNYSVSSNNAFRYDSYSYAVEKAHPDYKFVLKKWNEEDASEYVVTVKVNGKVISGTDGVYNIAGKLDADYIEVTTKKKEFGKLVINLDKADSVDYYLYSGNTAVVVSGDPKSSDYTVSGNTITGPVGKVKLNVVAKRGFKIKGYTLNDDTKAKTALPVDLELNSKEDTTVNVITDTVSLPEFKPSDSKINNVPLENVKLEQKAGTVDSYTVKIVDPKAEVEVLEGEGGIKGQIASGKLVVTTGAVSGNVIIRDKYDPDNKATVKVDVTEVDLGDEITKIEKKSSTYNSITLKVTRKFNADIKTLTPAEGNEFKYIAKISQNGVPGEIIIGDDADEKILVNKNNTTQEITLKSYAIQPNKTIYVQLYIVGCGTASCLSETFSDVKTQPAVYEYKLGLTKKAGSVFNDEENVLIAVPKWNASTTARDLVEETVAPGEAGFSIVNKKTGESVSQNCVIKYEPLTGSVMFTSVYDADPDKGLKAGTYRLTATAVYNDGANTPLAQASVDFTVKDRSFFIEADKYKSVYSEADDKSTVIVSKQPGKKVTVALSTYDYNKLPKKAKIGGNRTWKIENAESGDLPAGITINPKNGQITLDKMLVLDQEYTAKVTARYTNGTSAKTAESTMENHIYVRITPNEGALDAVFVATKNADGSYTALPVEKNKINVTTGQEYFVLPVATANKNSENKTYFEESLADKSITDLTLNNKKWTLEEVAESKAYKLVPVTKATGTLTAIVKDGTNKKKTATVVSGYNTNIAGFEVALNGSAVSDNSTKDKTKAVSCTSYIGNNNYVWIAAKDSNNNYIDLSQANVSVSVATNAKKVTDELDSGKKYVEFVATGYSKTSPTVVTITDNSKKGGAKFTFLVDFGANPANALKKASNVSMALKDKNVLNNTNILTGLAADISQNIIIKGKPADNKVATSVELHKDYATWVALKSQTDYNTVYDALKAVEGNLLTGASVYGNLPAGSYKFNVVFKDASGVISAPTPITVKVVKGKALGKINAATSYTMKVSENAVVNIKAAKYNQFVGTKYTAADDNNFTISVNALQNVSNKGEVNDFANTFKVVQKDAKNVELEYIGSKDLSRLFAPANTQCDKEAKKDVQDYVKKNFTGYLTYTVTYGIGLDGKVRTETKTIKVTVNVKKK